MNDNRAEPGCKMDPGSAYFVFYLKTDVLRAALLADCM